jgi:ketosteroid isomerase-like protein
MATHMVPARDTMNRRRFAIRSRRPPPGGTVPAPRWLPSTSRALALASALLLAAFAVPARDAAGLGRTPGSRPAHAGPARRAPGDSADVAAVVARFHAALAAGDSAAVLALLADDVVIGESGGVETRSDYRGHHLPADIEFARAVPSQRGPVLVRVQGDVAWASGTSVTQGEFRGRPLNSAGAELMVLSREPAGWRIRAIHWSSRTRRA